jgi:hypothetical protein
VKLYASMRLSTASLPLLVSLSAGASPDFVCVGSSPSGIFHFATVADSDHLPLFRPFAFPSLAIGNVEVDLSNASATVNGAWLVVRDTVENRRVFAMRKTRANPDFRPEIEHPFCDKRDWKESCWSAIITFPTTNGRATIKRAVCGIG